MATLKICTAKVIWITGVRRIIELGQFPIKKDEGDILSNIKGSGIDFGTSCIINQMEFEEGVKWGVAVKVEREECFSECPQIYVYPQRSSFLMSDSGVTIDRI